MYSKWVPKLIMILSFIDFIHMFIVSQMLQNSTTYYFHSTKIFIQLQQKCIQLQQKYLFNFNKNNFIQQKYLFNFNKNNFIQQKYLFNFNQQKFHSTTKFPDIQNIVIQQNSPCLPG